MDRYYHKVSTGVQPYFSLEELSVTQLKKNWPKNLTLPSKVERRLLLEQSGLPLNQQLYFFWKDAWETLETIIEFNDILGFKNIGVNTILLNNRTWQSTPLFQAELCQNLRGSWANILSYLEEEIIKFRKTRKIYAFDMLRCFPSPIVFEKYIGIRLNTILNQKNTDRALKFPFEIEAILNNYARAINNADSSLILTTKIDINGDVDTKNSPENINVDQIINQAKKFIQENAWKIISLGNKLNVPNICLDIEYLPTTGWFKVYDFEHFNPTSWQQKNRLP